MSGGSRRFVELELACRRQVAAGGSLEAIADMLHSRDVSILDAIKIVRSVGDVSPGEAKRIVTSRSAWRQWVEANEPLHEALESIARHEDECSGCGSLHPEG